MDVREKLVELVHNARMNALWHNAQKPDEYITDMLMEDGVTVQQQCGCEYCKEDSDGFRRMFGAFSLVNPFHGKTWQIHAGKCKPREIYFCPMCGRKLPQPPKGE